MGHMGYDIEEAWYELLPVFQVNDTEFWPSTAAMGMQV